MSNIITRDEYNKYISVKSKLGLQNKGTQTDFSADETQLIPIICTILPALEHNQTTTDEDTTDADDASSTDGTSTSQNTRSTKRQILNKLKKRRYVNPEDDEFYHNLPCEERKRVKTIEDTIYDEMKCETPLRFKILSSNINIYLKTLCLKKLDQLDAMHSHTDEYYKLHQWVESVVRLPIGKYKELPVDKNSDDEDITTFLNNIRKRLDNNVYGHQCTKEHIIRLLAKWISNKNSKGLVIGIEGEMGVGKTSLCLEICNALDLPYGFISLGGLSNSEYLVGHSYT